jgi:hypothetical protein
MTLGPIQRDKRSAYVLAMLSIGLLVTACGSSGAGSQSSDRSGAGSTGSGPSPTSVQSRDSAADLLPAAIRSSGVIRYAASFDYPPADFI